MRRSRGVARNLFDTLWQQPLWAVPFALFFWVMFGQGWRTLWLVYRVSLTFAFAIRLAIYAAHVAIVPRLAARHRRVPGAPASGWWIEGASYGAAAVVGAYVAAFLVHRFLVPGFLGSGRAVVMTALYTLLFTALFSGISYARHFYEQAVERARAVEQARAELALAELRALRAQIEPHFLFNTLNGIAALIAQDPRAAEDAVTRLADVFRYVLGASRQDQAALGAELAFLRDVLALERMRFGERLGVLEEVEPGLEDARMPSLLLQPLVENAVRHGVGGRPGGARITLRARRAGDRLVLEVEDDGPGFDAAARSAGRGFGLHSVRERLRALGPPHALDVDSSPDRGTRVRVTLPLEPTLPPSGGLP